MATPPPPGPRTTGGQDMPALTALRAVAALLVFLYHFAPKGLPWLAGVVAGQGHVGVTVFFVLSGFLITVRYYPRCARGVPRLGAYFARRAARILPLYYVVLTLTFLLTSGAIPFDRSHLAEWTLTQALFGPSPEAITIPTAWSLTVEECFYATAPLVYLGVAALRRRLGAVAGSLALLGALAVGVWLLLLLLVRTGHAVGTATLPFLTDETLLRYYTLIGRFPDFALGVAAGLLFLSGRVERLWQSARGAAWSSLLAVASTVLLVAGQAGMARDGADPAAAWRWNLLVGAASAGLVLALTCARAPLSRVLAVRPAVYLGRVSYALYLIQLTPLGNGLLQRLVPGTGAVHLLLLYAGMNLVAALLFELVEEPAREAIVTLSRTRSAAALPVAGTPRAQGLAVAILFGALAAQHVLWGLGSLPPVDEPRVLSVLGAGSPDVVRAAAPAPTAESEPRVRLPASWQVGAVDDRHAPRALLVFVDGQRVPFLGARAPSGPDAVAYFRGRRSGQLSLHITRPAMVTVVNHAPLVALRLAWSRMAAAPGVSVGPLLALAAAAVVLHTRRSALWSPRTCLAFAVGLVTLWLLTGLYRQRWAPAVLLLELAALTWVALSRRAAAAGPARMALES
jgi:peptidoglycan/LPS O-acetylase OafA/YrhL